MKRKIIVSNINTVFSQWSRKSYAIFLSLNKCIKIGFLSFTYGLLTMPLIAQEKKDTIEIREMVDLDEVEVIGQLNETEITRNARLTTLLSAGQISAVPATSFQDALEYSPGLDVQQRNENGIQADVSIRGGTFDQVMILLNGMNITDPQTGHHNLNLPIGINDIERIEILHGPGARLFGADAFSGAINVVTKSHSNEVFHGEVIGGNHGFIKTSASTGFACKKLKNYLSASYSKSSGYANNTDFRQFHGFYHAQADFEKQKASLQIGLNKKGFGANSFYSPKYPDQYEEILTGFGGLSLESDFQFPYRINAYWRRHYDHFILQRSNPSFYENYHRTDIVGTNATVSFKNKLGDFTIGVNAKADKIISTVLGEEMSREIPVSGADTISYLYGTTTYHLHFFAEQNVAFKKLYLSFGLMAGTSSFLDNQIKLYPGIDGAYWLTNNIKISSSVQKTLRSPTYTDLYYEDPTTLGNDGLRPEEAIGLDIGLNIYKKYWSVYSYYYHQAGDNLIAYVWQPENSYRIAQNIANVSVYGIETGFKISPPVEWFKSASIGYMYNTINKSEELVNNNLKHKITASFKYQLSSYLSVSWGVRYIQREGAYVTYNDDNGSFPLIRFKPYWLTDAKISYQWNFIRLFFNISNLFDKKYHEITNLQQPGRWMKVGFNLNINKQ